ncbi:hypothetical protein CBW46_011035 [Paenibacillus xerothermodurans]|uniref:Uncharacterized protein n=1 Tax=Paenibacillus xerothermodurans TaxID=1977292 RepID=A0A2W1NP63_PAEXE|nr:hypothetical protein CBW46_011035 [Paenibacillus xerothermodurans]
MAVCGARVARAPAAGHAAGAAIAVCMRAGGQGGALEQPSTTGAAMAVCAARVASAALCSGGVRPAQRWPCAAQFRCDVSHC